jgi:hypothetical protein
VLHLTDEPARTFREATRKQGRPVISLTTTDCAGDTARLKAKGVVFVREPARMDYGGMDAVATTPAATSSTSTRTELPAAPRVLAAPAQLHRPPCLTPTRAGAVSHFP